MIDGVRIRFVVTVWNATVAVAWQNATMAITSTFLPRRPTIRQNPSVPAGIGLSQMTRPRANTAVSTIRPVSTIQYRRRTPVLGSGPERRSRRAGARLVAMSLAMAPLPEDQDDEHCGTDHAEDQ